MAEKTKTTKTKTAKAAKAPKKDRYRATGEPERRKQRRAKVLCPIDFSECSRRALEFSVQYCERVPSELYLFHVFEPVNRLSFAARNLVDKLDKELERMESMALAELESMVKDKVRKEQLKNFHCRVGSGKAWEEILRMAGNINADIIVMGTHGRDGLERALIGSQTEKVVRKAPCTVVCVKEKDPYFVMP